MQYHTTRSTMLMQDKDEIKKEKSKHQYISWTHTRAHAHKDRRGHARVYVKTLWSLTCGTREVGVDNFFRVRVEVDEHPEDVFPGVDGVPLGTYEDG